MSEKEHSVDFSDDKIAPCVCGKDISSAFSCESASGADADAEYSLSAGGAQSERNLQPSVYQTVYGDGVPAANGKSRSDLPGG